MQDTPTRTGTARLRLDTRRRTLTCGGLPVELGDRAFDLFVFLATHRDRLLTRVEIEAHVWAGAVVAPNNLTVQMSALRLALEKQGCAGVIQTVTGRGYRFIGDIDIDPQDAEPVTKPLKANASPASARSKFRPRVRIWLWAGAGVAACVAAGSWFWLIRTPPPSVAPLSIAVLPFRNLSADPSQNYMADAITDDLTTDLSHIPKSVVIANESTSVFRNSAQSLRQIGNVLHVRYLVRGSILAQEGSYHVNVNLLDALTGQTLWAENFDSSDVRLADTRKAIVRQIAGNLDLRLTDFEGSRMLQTSDPDALGLFFRARSIRRQEDTLSGFQQAQELLETAIHRQPGFGQAYAELGLTLVLKALQTEDPDDDADIARARQVIGQALSLAPENATALVARGRLEQSDWHCSASIESARAALASEPDNFDAHSLLAKCFAMLGQLDQASAEIEELFRLNPEGRTNLNSHLLLGQVRLLQGQYKDAIQQTTMSIASDPEPAPGAATMGRAEYARLLLMAAHALAGDKASAQQIYQHYREIWPHRSVWRVAAYSSAATQALSGFQAFRQGLEQAGMPMFADEHVNDGIAPSTEPLPQSDFASTPLHVPGIETLDASALVRMAAQGPVHMVDVGRGTAVPLGATFQGCDVTDVSTFLRKDLSKIPAAVPVIIFSDGVYGTDGYNAALIATKFSASRIYWFRGGEEAWAREGRPSGYACAE